MKQRRKLREPIASVYINIRASTSMAQGTLWKRDQKKYAKSQNTRNSAVKQQPA